MQDVWSFTPLLLAVMVFAAIVAFRWHAKPTKAQGTLAFRNPANGYVETISRPGLWTFLFGPFYFAAKGVWMHVLLGVVLVFVTGFGAWLVYPFFARDLIARHYLRAGWQRIAA